MTLPAVTLGVLTSSLGTGLTPPQMLERIASLEVQSCQLGWYEVWLDEEKKGHMEEALLELKKAQQRTGVTIDSLCLYYNRKDPPSSNTWVGQTVRALYFAHKLGVSVVGQHIHSLEQGNGNQGFPSIDPVTRDTIELIDSYADSLGVRYTLETMTESLDTMKELTRGLSLAFSFDAANLVYNEWNRETILDCFFELHYIGAIGAIHLKDVTPEGLFVPLGKGCVPLKDLTQLAREQGYTHFILEEGGDVDKRYHQLQQSLDYARNTLFG